MKVTINCISSWTTLDSFAGLQAQQEVGAEIDTVFMASTKYIFIRFCLARHFFLLANNQIGGVGLAHPRLCRITIINRLVAIKSATTWP